MNAFVDASSSRKSSYKFCRNSVLICREESCHIGFKFKFSHVWPKERSCYRSIPSAPTTEFVLGKSCIVRLSGNFVWRAGSIVRKYQRAVLHQFFSITLFGNASCTASIVNSIIWWKIECSVCSSACSQNYSRNAEWCDG